MNRVLALVDDLMFLSRVREEANRSGSSFSSVSTAEALVASWKADRPRLVLVDLSVRSADPVEAIARLRSAEAEESTEAAEGTAEAAGSAAARVRLIAWGPHGDVDRLEAARVAGADESLARGAFAQRLPELLRA